MGTKFETKSATEAAGNFTKEKIIKMNNYPIVLAFKVGIEFTFACFNLN